jgi:hypothetical protein
VSLNSRNARKDEKAANAGISIIPPTAEEQSLAPRAAFLVIGSPVALR